jgi:hypothetical protein
MWLRMRALALILVPLIAGVCGCEKSPSLSTYQTVVANVAAGKQLVSANGEIVLPASQASSTAGGKAYATTQPSGSSMILFPTWWGKGTNLRGYLYDPGPPLTSGSSVSVNVPFPSPVIAPKFVTREITIESVVAPSWYYVSRSLD